MTQNRTQVFFVACILAFTLLGCSSFAQAPTATVERTPKPTATILSNQLSVMPSPTPQRCTVTGTVYLRPDPSKAHAPLAILHDGQILEVIERGAWLKVSTRTTTGFIYSRFCEQE